MKKLLILIVLCLILPALPVSASGLRENEVINIAVIVNRDNSIEIITSTTEQQFIGKCRIRIYADGDIPGEVLSIYEFGIPSGNTDHTTWYDAGEQLKPGRYFAVVGSEFSADVGVPRAYFTIPAIEQWWTPQPTATPAPTPPIEGPAFINLAAIVDPDTNEVTIKSYTSVEFDDSVEFNDFEAVWSIYAEGDKDSIYSHYPRSSKEETILSLPKEKKNYYIDGDGKLIPGRYYAVMKISMKDGTVLSSDPAYFTIPGTYLSFRTAKPAAQKTPTPATSVTPVPTSSPSGGNAVHIAASIILGAVICAQFAVILYLIKKKK